MYSYKSSWWLVLLNWSLSLDVFPLEIHYKTSRKCFQRIKTERHLKKKIGSQINCQSISTILLPLSTVLLDTALK